MFRILLYFKLLTINLSLIVNLLDSLQSPSLFILFSISSLRFNHCIILFLTLACEFVVDWLFFLRQFSPSPWCDFNQLRTACLLVFGLYFLQRLLIIHQKCINRLFWNYFVSFFSFFCLLFSLVKFTLVLNWFLIWV